MSRRALDLLLAILCVITGAWLAAGQDRWERQVVALCPTADTIVEVRFRWDGTRLPDRTITHTQENGCRSTD